MTVDQKHHATIAAVSTLVPPYLMRHEEVKQALQGIFALKGTRLDAMMRLVDNSHVEKRYSVFPIEHIVQKRSLTTTSAEYQEHSIILGRKVAQDCLNKAGLKATDIDYLITVSCTGVMIPSLDAYLANDLQFRSNVRRLPITEWGCAAGAIALTKAYEFILAYPNANVLIVSVELTTLTLQQQDQSQSNLVSCAIFGDGAAAVLVTGKDMAGPKIIDTESQLFPNSLDMMGFNLKDGGLHIVLSKRVPEMIKEHASNLFKSFLDKNRLILAQIAALILHPGGKKLLNSIEEELCVSRSLTQPSWDVLSQYGNMSSATVLFVLKEWLENKELKRDDYGLLVAFGPGFSAESLLLQW